MVVVSSAGNEGANPWHYLTAPADADSIITVGSVTTSLERSSFSGFGPSSDGRIKPTVCALGTNTAVINELGEVSTNNGTSLSAPIITGLTACLWQALPSLTNMQIVELIKKHSTKYETPDNELGYGIPDFYAAYIEASGVGNKSLSSVDLVRVFPNPIKDTLSLDIDPSIIGRDPELILYTVNGKKIFKKKLIEINEKISLDKIPQGNYTLTVLLGRIVILKQQLIKE
jgi:subtilisin family serine protease